MSKGLLIVDDNAGAIERVKYLAEGCEFTPILTANSKFVALGHWKERGNEIAVVVLDLDIDGKGDGWQLLETFKKTRALDDFELMVYSGHLKEVKFPLEAIRRQTVSLFVKLEDDEQLRRRLRLISERFKRSGTAFYFSDEEKTEMDAVANSCSPLLIVGSPGSGKTIKAREIAARSGCAKDRTYLINCASLSRELAEAELFGYMRGSFTSAFQNKVGKMMAASGYTESDLMSNGSASAVSPKGFRAHKSKEAQWGAVILDEVGSLDPVVQAKLLLVIEGEPMYPVGWTTEGFLPNFRVIAATNEVKKLRDEEVFRRDLFGRLSTYVMKCKDLGDESDEVISEIIKSITLPTRVNGRPAPSITPRFAGGAIDELLSKKRQIRGGYRELQSVVERAWVNAKKRSQNQQDVEIRVEDVRRGLTYSVELYSLLETNDDTPVATEVELLSEERVEELKTKLVERLDLDPQKLSPKNFQVAIAQAMVSGHGKDLKQEIDAILGVAEADRFRKKSIYTALGQIIGRTVANKAAAPGTVAYADYMSNYYSTLFVPSRARKSTSEDPVE